ncbi:MAG: hypothetical protein OXJ53_19815 [Gammaproteobacteria bacterium]|nr:hypothetical protein [Gammaproteobacteria bacterium]MDE0271879.1 hypothetical protein [Gammaproteobacteria bacterium]
MKNLLTILVLFAMPYTPAEGVELTRGAWGVVAVEDEFDEPTGKVVLATWAMEKHPVAGDCFLRLSGKPGYWRGLPDRNHPMLTIHCEYMNMAYGSNAARFKSDRDSVRQAGFVECAHGQPCLMVEAQDYSGVRAVVKDMLTYGQDDIVAVAMRYYKDGIVTIRFPLRGFRGLYKSHGYLPKLIPKWLRQQD